MKIYEIHCNHCSNLLVVEMEGPPVAGLSVPCLNCRHLRVAGEPVLRILAETSDPREWVGAICDHCGLDFEWPRYAAFPDQYPAPKWCRNCFLVLGGTSIVHAKRDADEWKACIDQRNLLWAGTDARCTGINTGPCPPVALRPDAQTVPNSIHGLSEMHQTYFNYESVGSTRQLSHQRTVCWHPSVPHVLEITTPTFLSGSSYVGVNCTSRTTGEMIANYEFRLDAPILEAFTKFLAPKGPSPMDQAARQLVTAWDNNQSVSASIDALRALLPTH